MSASCLTTHHYGNLSKGGQKDLAADCSGDRVLEYGEILDAATAVVPNDPAEIDVSAVQILSEDTRVDNRLFPAFRSVGFRCEHVGTQLGEQIIWIDVVGDSGTSERYKTTVNIIEAHA